jgi:hypothetical protein
MVIWNLFGDFYTLLHFGPYPYSYLRIGPDYEELTDGQDHSESQEDFEEPQVHAHLRSDYLLGIAC